MRKQKRTQRERLDTLEKVVTQLYQRQMVLESQRIRHQPRLLWSRIKSVFDKQE